MNLSHVLKVNLAGAALLLGSGSFANYSFSGIGFLPNAVASYGFAVSGDGRVVTGSSGSQAMRWTAVGGMTGLGRLTGDAQSVANGLSFDGGVIVGVSYGSLGSQAFRWTQVGGLSGLGSLSSPNDSSASAVSADGSVVVGDDGGHAFRWTQGTGITLFGQTNENVFYVDAVTANGNAIVGKAADATAFWWPQSGGMTHLNLPGSTTSEAWDVTPDGSIIVGYASAMGAFRMVSGSGVGSVGNGDARAVSSTGSVVVGCSASGNAFLWTNSTGQVNLKSYLQQHGVSGLDTWTLAAAEDVSYDGTTIVGEGVDPAGRIQAFVATIDPPDQQFAPTSFSMFRGILLAGGLPELLNSDDTYVIARPGVVLSSAEAPVQIIINGTSPISSPSVFQTKVEARANSTSIAESVDFYNFTTSTYEQMYSAPATLTDSTQYINAPTNASRFLESGTRNVRVRLRFKAFAPILSYPWQVRVDQVRFTVAP